MKKSFLRSITALLPVFLLSIPPLHAEATWTLAGLKDQTINTILPMTTFGGEALMVGTEKGIWWYQRGDWDTAWTGLPVNDMVMTPSGVPIAIAGQGSDSDGVYMGRITGIAKITQGGIGMDTWWGFTFQQRYPLPTAVAFTALDGDCEGRVYVGNYSGAASGLFCNRLEELTAMPGSANAFGQVCASMTFFSGDGMLYAGGNNTFYKGEYLIVPFSFMPPNEYQPGNNANRKVSIVGPNDTWLMRGMAELSQFKRLNVTSMVEYVSENKKMLAVATVDSGIKAFNSEGTLCLGIPSPVHNEPVGAVVPFAAEDYGNGKWRMLVAATPSGVFRQCPPMADCIWSEIGNLPRPPRCLAQFNGTTLWAGTDSGVYRYDYATGAVQQSIAATPLRMRVSALRGEQGSIRFDLDDPDGAGYALGVFDLRGRCVTQVIAAGKQTVVTGLGRGMFLYRAMRNGRIAASGSVMCH